MKRPTIHLICSAHLDPVWQWRWEEGCAEALSTFNNAVQLLERNDSLVFNHNEAVLYRWVQKYDSALFREIQKLVRKGRWCISGGWYLQPDVNMPGTESIIRNIAEGRKFFVKYFGAQPITAYNFDSFGHSGGLPQILSLAGYRMYIHMRPGEPDLRLPSDLYRWHGVDGSEILTYRIAVGLYHTERDNIEQRLQEGLELALKLNRDVPVFWGIGNHGGGATREDLERINTFIGKEKRVRVIHSTPEILYTSFKKLAKSVPIVEGDLQKIFTGCYTSLSRIKRGAQKDLAELVQAEALRTMAWWTRHQIYPDKEFEDAWRDHLFNDFHDILPGSCTEPAESDALALYGRTSETIRRLRFPLTSAAHKGGYRNLYIPVTVLNTNSALFRVPVEVECMLDLRPKWSGFWHLQLYDLNGKEIPCQEEQPESLLPFNGWRRKVSFFANLPQLGASHYELRIVEGKGSTERFVPALKHTIDARNGLIRELDAGDGRECLAGYLMQPIVVDDDGDSWGTDRWSYRTIVGKFETLKDSFTTPHDGPVRKTTERVLVYNRSKIVYRVTVYPNWPVIEFHLRILWNEERKRLKLSTQTAFKKDRILCEVPGGAIYRPSDGQEHVQGRWCMVEGTMNEKQTGFAIINSGQHGFDFKDGEIRLSVLRSAAYCHEQGFKLGSAPARKYMDLGIHDIRLLVTAGDADAVRKSLSGLADWLSAPPVVFSHLPIGRLKEEEQSFLELEPSVVRLLACKQSSDGKAAIIRLQETAGCETKTTIQLRNQKKLRLSFAPYEIKTLRFERSGKFREVGLLEEL